MKTVNVEVTQNIINLGTIGSSEEGPLAIAIRQHTHYVPRVGSDHVYYYLDDNVPEASALLPEEARKFARLYNNPETRHLAVPFSFKIEVLD